MRSMLRMAKYSINPLIQTALINNPSKIDQWQACQMQTSSVTRGRRAGNLPWAPLRLGAKIHVDLDRGKIVSSAWTRMRGWISARPWSRTAIDVDDRGFNRLLSHERKHLYGEIVYADTKSRAA